MNPVDIRVTPHEPWFKYGVTVLLFEMALAVAVGSTGWAAFPASTKA